MTNMLPSSALPQWTVINLPVDTLLFDPETAVQPHSVDIADDIVTLHHGDMQISIDARNLHHVATLRDLYTDANSLEFPLTPDYPYDDVLTILKWVQNPQSVRFEDHLELLPNGNMCTRSLNALYECADYYHCEPFMNAIAEFIANGVIERSAGTDIHACADKIRDWLNEPDDFSAEEKETIIKENKWLYDLWGVYNNAPQVQ